MSTILLRQVDIRPFNEDLIFEIIAAVLLIDVELSDVFCLVFEAMSIATRLSSKSIFKITIAGAFYLNFDICERIQLEAVDRQLFSKYAVRTIMLRNVFLNEGILYRNQIGE
ncbi:unnamed protein product [Adineta ricciae]|uniref:Uncharacterized protein n=1 Tax=Adineta ricciae TaxID=249248 RepID=A0A814XSG1_ADIRI|nr:unnamed protein product [Adineta ricciae]